MKKIQPSKNTESRTKENRNRAMAKEKQALVAKNGRNEQGDARRN